MVEVGAKAPSFSVLDHTGKKVSLESLRGKKVVLWFYPKADTPGCTAEGCAFRDRQAEFEKLGAVLYGVSFDTVAENAAFAQKFGFEFPLLCDTERQIGIAYGACATAKDTYAKRIAYLISETGTVLKAFPKVEAAAFPQQVLEMLTA
ncbi:peroxiredoxin [bacterium]|nr:peroxiredoxin [bacterium]